MKLERADQLVNGLSGERTRWEGSLEALHKDIENSVGDCVIAAAFLSYAGPFNSDFRHILVKDTWLPMVEKLNIPYTKGFDFASFLAKPTDVREWNLKTPMYSSSAFFSSVSVSASGSAVFFFPLDDENAPGTAAAVMSTDVTFILGQNVTTVAGFFCRIGAGTNRCRDAALRLRPDPYEHNPYRQICHQASGRAP